MSRDVVHVGPKFRVAVDQVALPNGTTVRKDVVLHPGAVVILPVVDEKHVCLLRNYRHAVGETLWEVPAGTLEPGEPVETAAVRELEEETGYRAAKWRSFGFIYPSPGVMDEKLYLFVAEELTAGPNHPEAGEQLEPHTVAFDEAVRMCLDGRIRDGKTIAMLLLWEKAMARG